MLESSWLATHWFELIQTAGIVAGLVFNGYTTRKDSKERRISNLSAFKQDHIDIWSQTLTRPELDRVLDMSADLTRQPVSKAEWTFVKLLIIHLDSVYRAIQAGLFVDIGGLRRDIEDFFSAPIPKAVWEKMKGVQDAEFVRFIESSLE